MCLDFFFQISDKFREFCNVEEKEGSVRHRLRLQECNILHPNRTRSDVIAWLIEKLNKKVKITEQKHNMNILLHHSTDNKQTDNQRLSYFYCYCIKKKRHRRRVHTNFIQHKIKCLRYFLKAHWALLFICFSYEENVTPPTSEMQN